MIYFVQDGDGSPIKIGRSVTPQKRIRMLQTGNARRLRVLATAPGSAQRESEIHRRLAAHRVQGEWYHPAPEVFALIAEVQAPEYQVLDGRAYAVLRRPDEASPTRACPFCGVKHTHGVGDGHRAAHCADGADDQIVSGNVTLVRDHGYLVITD